VAAPDIPAMPYHPVMEDFFMPNREKIATAARELAAY
jgi:pyruvate/2-oxoglutarate/acetoin dehydrogenase E1 component